jgi:hypothetical protein
MLYLKNIAYKDPEEFKNETSPEHRVIFIKRVSTFSSKYWEDSKCPNK